MQNPQRVLTVTEMTTWQACPRKRHVRFDLGYVPVEKEEPLEFGDWVHAGLEAYWRARKARGRDPGAAALATIPRAADGYEAARLRVMLTAYAAVWDRTWAEVLHVEKTFRLPLRDPATFAPSAFWHREGKIDLLLRARDRRVVLVEHKCVPGTAEVYDHASGRRRTIDELVASGELPRVTAMTAAGALTEARVSAIRPAGVRPVWTVETAGGRALRASGNHPVWTHRGWCAVADIVPGDWVATPRAMPSSVADGPWSDEALRLVGYMLGDGHCPGPLFTKSDVGVVADVLRCAAALGEPARVRAAPTDRVSTIQFSTVGPVARLLTAVGMREWRSADKRIPVALALSDRQLGQVLGALWSTDGCIDAYRVCDRHAPKLRIIYTSVSRALCVDIQHALQRLGVTSNVRDTSVSYRGARRAVSTVQVVSRASKRRFLDLALAGVLPVTRSAVAVGHAAALVSGSAVGVDARMQPRLDEDLWWDRVRAVTEGPPAAVFDVTVPEHHTFVVDGVVTHNTSAEEVGSGTPYNRRLTLDEQISYYTTGAESLGYKLDQILYDVLRKPRQQPLAATPEAERRFVKDRATKEMRLAKNQRAHDESSVEYEQRLGAVVGASLGEYVVRTVVHRFAHERGKAEANAWAIAEHIRFGIERGYHPTNSRACFQFRRPCPYLPVCEGTGRLEDPRMYRRLPVVHPELAARDEIPVAGTPRTPAPSVAATVGQGHTERPVPPP